MLQYRERFYSKYSSAFKARIAPHPDYEFGASKLRPLISAWLDPIDRSLPCIDLGCGHGNLLYILQQLGFHRLQGVDLSAEQVAIARKTFDCVHVESAGNALAAAEDNYFGVITLFDVIEHLTKDELLEIFDLCFSKLKPGGILIVHCPNGNSPFVGAIRYGDFTHETIVTPGSAGNLCAIAGLGDFEAREHLGASSGVAGEIRKIAWHILRLGLSCFDLVETGSRGSGIYTRNFAFKATKPLPGKTEPR